MEDEKDRKVEKGATPELEERELTDADRKLVFEFFKYLATLNSAAIALLFTLAALVQEKIAAQNLFNVFWFLGASILGCLIMMGSMAMRPAKTHPMRKLIGLATIFTFIYAVWFFASVVGIAFDGIRLIEGKWTMVN